MTDLSLSTLSTDEIKFWSEKIIGELPARPARLIRELDEDKKADVIALHSFWKNAAYHCVRPEHLGEELEGSNGHLPLLESIWREKWQDTLRRLRNLSRSSLPELDELKWAILIERATESEAAKREVKGLLQIVTDKGNLSTKLDYDQLKELHLTLQAIQGKLDAITK